MPREAASVPGPVAFSLDGKLLAVAHTSRELKIVDAATCQDVATFPTPDPHQIAAMSFSDDGARLIVICANNVLQVWDLQLVRQRLKEMRLDWQ